MNKLNRFLKALEEFFKEYPKYEVVPALNCSGHEPRLTTLEDAMKNFFDEEEEYRITFKEPIKKAFDFKKEEKVCPSCAVGTSSSTKEPNQRERVESYLDLSIRAMKKGLDSVDETEARAKARDIRVARTSLEDDIRRFEEPSKGENFYELIYSKIVFIFSYDAELEDHIKYSAGLILPAAATEQDEKIRLELLANLSELLK